MIKLQDDIIRHPFSRNKVIIDLEFNTVPKSMAKHIKLKNEIIEIGAVKVDSEYKVTDKFRMMVRPEFNSVIDKKIFKLTQIENKDVREACMLAEVIGQFESWLGTDPIRIYSWSTSDFEQVKKECNRKSIDTLLLDDRHTKWVDLQRIFGLLTDHDTKVKLADAIEYCDIKLKGHEHDAFYDAIHTAEIARLIKTGEVSRIKRYEESVVCREPIRSTGGLPLEQRQKLEKLLKALNEDEEKRKAS